MKVSWCHIVVVMVDSNSSTNIVSVQQRQGGHPGLVATTSANGRVYGNLSILRNSTRREGGCSTNSAHKFQGCIRLEDAEDHVRDWGMCDSAGVHA